MSYMTSARFLGALRRTPLLLKTMLQPISAEQARAATDGPDGWNIAEVVGHLNDFETIFLDRIEAIVEQDKPNLIGYDQDALVRERNHGTKDVHALFADTVEKRRALVGYLEGLSEDQWARVGVHPENGDITVYEIAMQTALHDVLHMEQIMKALGTAEPVV